jgi:hypothetical protein
MRENKMSKYVTRFAEMLTNTNIMSVVHTKERLVSEDQVSMYTLSRLLPGISEDQWVHDVVMPLRDLSRRLSGVVSIRTAKEYVDKVVNGEYRTVFAFVISITTPDPDSVLSAINTSLFGAVEDRLDIGHGLGGKKTIADLPDEVIERPLAHAPANRNEIKTTRTEDGRLLHGAGVRNVAS